MYYETVPEEQKSEEIIPSLRGVCGCISLGDINLKAESKTVINFFFHIVLSCDPLCHFIVLFH